MSDPVTDAANDLADKLRNLSAISTKVVYLYDQDDMLDATKKLRFPAIGIVYVGMRARSSDKSKTGLPADMVFDLYVVAGQQCQDKISNLKVGTTQLLDDMRGEIKCTRLERVGARRKWRFVSETPEQIKNDKKEYLAYRQRWETVIVLTN